MDDQRRRGGLRAKEYVQRAWRRLVLLYEPVSWFRAIIWRLRGADVGQGTKLTRAEVTWPHQVRIGRNCILQPDIFFNYDHYWTPGPSIILGDRVFVGRGVEFNIQGSIQIDDDALIASGCMFVDHDHGMEAGAPMNVQPSEIGGIRVGKGAWIGAKVVVLKGVEIGDAAVIGAGSIVTKSVPPREVWCGVPARMIRRPKCGEKAVVNARGSAGARLMEVPRDSCP